MRQSIFLAISTLSSCLAITGMAEASPPSAKTRLDVQRGRAAGIEAGDLAKEKFHGTQILPHQTAEGTILKFQKDITTRFALQENSPPQRLAHFQWLDRPDIGIRGWRGQIQQVVKSNNGWLVMIRVSPIIVSDKAAATVTLDYYMETYEYSPAGLRFIKGIDPPDAVRSISYN